MGASKRRIAALRPLGSTRTRERCLAEDGARVSQAAGWQGRRITGNMTTVEKDVPATAPGAWPQLCERQPAMRPERGRPGRSPWRSVRTGGLREAPGLWPAPCAGGRRHRPADGDGDGVAPEQCVDPGERRGHPGRERRGATTGAGPGGSGRRPRRELWCGGRGVSMTASSACGPHGDGAGTPDVDSACAISISAEDRSVAASAIVRRCISVASPAARPRWASCLSLGHPSGLLPRAEPLPSMKRHLNPLLAPPSVRSLS